MLPNRNRQQYLRCNEILKYKSFRKHGAVGRTDEFKARMIIKKWWKNKRKKTIKSCTIILLIEHRNDSLPKELKFSVQQLPHCTYNSMPVHAHTWGPKELLPDICVAYSPQGMMIGQFLHPPDRGLLLRAIPLISNLWDKAHISDTRVCEGKGIT